MSEKELTIDDPLLISHIEGCTDLVDKFEARGQTFTSDSDRNSHFLDFCHDEIINECQVIHESEAFGRDNDPFPITVNEYQGIFFVWALEFDDRGFFLDRESAMGVVDEYIADFPDQDT